MRKRRDSFLWLLVIVLGLGGAIAAEQADESPADEAFIRSLAEDDAPVDTRRLARLFFSAASTLEGGRTSVRLLEEAVSLRDPRRESKIGVLRARYDDFAESVTRLKRSTSLLLDAPDSAARLYRTLMDGHHACWRFDAVVGLAATYGVPASDRMSVLASSQACDRLRRAAFQPRVEALVQQGLSGDDELILENRTLREELHALERLLDELRRIDEQ